MKRFIPILSIFFSLFATISCGSQYFTIDMLSGVYIGESIPQYTREITRNQEEIMAFLNGDSSQFQYSYIVYNELLPFTLELQRDSSFNIGAIEFIFGAGHWHIIGKDSLMLSFNSYPKDSVRYAEIAMGPLQYEGIRKLKIINKNKLRFDYFPYNASNNSAITIIYKRQKRNR